MRRVAPLAQTFKLVVSWHNGPGRGIPLLYTFEYHRKRKTPDMTHIYVCFRDPFPLWDQSLLEVEGTLQDMTMLPQIQLSFEGGNRIDGMKFLGVLTTGVKSSSTEARYKE
jgi:hypothetical protein